MSVAVLPGSRTGEDGRRKVILLRIPRILIISLFGRPLQVFVGPVGLQSGMPRTFTARRESASAAFLNGPRDRLGAMTVSDSKAIVTPAVSSDSRRLPWFGGLLLIACLGIYFCLVQIGWNHTLLGDHGFRQTQTAISTYYMIGKAPKLAYETPIMGPSWSIPFEFPLYQWIVAAIVSVLHTPLDQTGRFVSVCFFLLTFFPLYFLLGKLKLAPANRLVVLAAGGDSAVRVLLANVPDRNARIVSLYLLPGAGLGVSG